MAVTSVQASLIIRGLDPSQTAAAVTAALGIEPTKSHEFGEPHQSPSLAARGKTTPSSLWRFDELRTEASEGDFHGMQSLVTLTERFAPHAATLAELRQHYDIIVDLWGHSDSTQVGWVIGEETMRLLGTMSAALFQTVYADPDSE